MSTVDRKNPQSLAEACAQQMWHDDNASKKLGMQLENIAPGSAEISMTITDDMINGHGSGHGGYLFTLADSTFAFACNTYNQRCVAQHCTISYLAPALKGDQLLAVGSEVSRIGRNGIYDVRITNQDNQTLVEFRGYSRTVSGGLLPEDKTDAS